VAGADQVEHRAGRDILVVLLENGHTPAEKTLHAAGHVQQLLDGRHILQTIVEDDLKQIVQQATGRSVLTMLSATRLDPDLSVEIFILNAVPPVESEPVADRAQAARTRAQELQEETRAVTEQSRQALSQTAIRRQRHP
jgi:uncharacterized protein YbcI